MRRLAVLSMHTSPLAQPGTGDGGGMNVYVRQLSAALARAGVECEVFTRAWSPDLPATVQLEPGLRVHHVPAGPLERLPKEELPYVVDEFSDGVLGLLTNNTAPWTGGGADAIHANYWLSGIAGHRIKHELEVPLVCTFHTLDRVKAETSPEEVGAAEPALRSMAEAEVIGCSDAVLASCTVEAHQLEELYRADPARTKIVAPAVDHAFFSPGQRGQARRALGLPADARILLFVGRIQPLKAADVAVRTLSRLSVPDAFLVLVGGPSGLRGPEELGRLHRLVKELRLESRVRFVVPQPHELLSTYYRAADMCLVPSRAESFGLVALEAGACGTPVVASGVGGLTTIVRHGHTGYLVEPGALDHFVVHTEKILFDRELAADFGSNAAAEAERYTWSTAGARLRAIYAELTDRRLVECR